MRWRYVYLNINWLKRAAPTESPALEVRFRLSLDSRVY